MTGTSMDGLDACLIEVSSAGPKLCAFASEEMPAPLRQQLMALQSGAVDDPLDAAALAALALSDASAALVARLRAQDSRPVRAVGLHGQTVRHRPHWGYSVQIAAPARLAELTGLDVVFDFRSRDLAAGGQGAPLVPIFHREMLAAQPRPSAATWSGILNLGGMANLSLFGPGDAVVGFDTGPGNVLLDAWAARELGQPFDRDGQWSGRGTVSVGLLDQLLAHPYFAGRGPKSTGRDTFHDGWLQGELLQWSGLPAEDVAATLVALTARTIGEAIAQVCGDDLGRLFVCGGGSQNQSLMAALEAQVGMPIAPSEALGWPSQTVEAAAFAWLAHLCLEGRPGNLPEVTGASGPRCLGAVCRA